jgi:cytochrome c biogenesis factor
MLQDRSDWQAIGMGADFFDKLFCPLSIVTIIYIQYHVVNVKDQHMYLTL